MGRSLCMVGSQQQAAGSSRQQRSSSTRHKNGWVLLAYYLSTVRWGCLRGVSAVSGGLLRRCPSDRAGRGCP
jgi:hypothetical protein